MGRAGGRRQLVRRAPAGQLGAAAGGRRPAGRRGDLRGAGRPAARLPHAAGAVRTVRRRGGGRGPDRHPGLARPAGAAGCPAQLGAGHPALQRPVGAVLGGRRPRRPRRPGGLGGAELGAGFVLVNPLHAAEPVAPMEPSPYLPTSRRFANPLYLRVERIPEYAYLVACRTGPRWTRCAARCGCRLDGVDRIDRDTGWAAKRAALQAGARGPARRRPRAGVPGVPAARGAGAGATSPPGARWPRSTAPTGTPGRRTCGTRARPPSAPFRAEHQDAVDFHRWLQWVLDEQLGAAQAAALRCRDGARRHARPGGRRAPGRRGRLGAAGRLRPAGDGRRPAGRVQPARPGLDAAAVAAGPARRGRLRAVPGHGLDRAAARRRAAGRPRHRAVPAVVDARRAPADRGHLRPLRPRGDDRDPGAGGAPGRRGRRRRGPRRRRAVGAGLPARARHPRHLDPVVRVRVRRRTARRCARSGGGSTAWPR